MLGQGPQHRKGDLIVHTDHRRRPIRDRQEFFHRELGLFERGDRVNRVLDDAFLRNQTDASSCTSNAAAPVCAL